MYKKIAGFFIIMCTLLLPTSVGADSVMDVSTGEVEVSQVICLPGIYMTLPADCTPAGPSLSSNLNGSSWFVLS